VQFIVARRRKSGAGSWEFFNRMKLNKIVTSVQVACIENNKDCMVALEYANMWGEVPIIGFNSGYWKYANKFRKLIEKYLE
jgi:hypothetical protein